MLIQVFIYLEALDVDKQPSFLKSNRIHLSLLKKKTKLKAVTIGKSSLNFDYMYSCFRRSQFILTSTWNVFIYSVCL